ncbi:MAG TPA: Crp/Fnr family transcriptional regulator [Puia sp.]|nr:Crp/Fnr family transcriptional regulator [Puia sp.]
MVATAYDSYEKILTYIGKFVQLTDDEKNAFSACFKEVKVVKRQFIVQPHFTAKSRFFVVKGALRAYVVGDEGQDHTIQLAIDEWWISDYNSYIFQQPANMFVVALEDCVLLQINFEDEKMLKASNHKFETFFRILAERSTASMQRRIITNLTMSAEERYDSFVKKYPLMVERIPQYAIASFLGMTTEFLSKIRNKKIKRR